MILLRELLDEVEFRKQKNLIHISDLPMFSIFIPASPDRVTPIELLKLHYGKNEKIKSVFNSARNQIHQIGFPSMHANVILRDLSKEPNRNTGDLGVGGLAHPYKKYMEVDIKHLSPDIVVHEWAHLWMMNNSKDFKKAVETFYRKMLKDTGNKVDISDIPSKPLSNEEELSIIDSWGTGIEKMFGYLLFDRSTHAYILKKKKLTPELFPKLPHLISFDARLKRPITAYSLNGSRSEMFPVGADVNIIKGNSGWLIGKDIGGSRYEILTDTFDELFDYVESNKSGDLIADIQSVLQQHSQRNKQYNTPKYLTGKLDKEVKSGLRRIFEDIAKKFQAKPTQEEMETVQSWSKFIVPRYLEILRNSKLLKYYEENRDKIYDTLWVSNQHKPADTSFGKFFGNILNRSRSDAYKQTFTDKGSLSGQEFGEHRQTMAKLNNWLSSYGMSNEDELWATAVEYFFKLPQSYRKSILKIMNYL